MGSAAREGDQVAGGDGGEAGIFRALTPVPAQADQHQGVRHAAAEGQKVAARRVGRGGGDGIAACEEQGQAGANGEDIEDVGTANGFAQQKRAEKQDVEGGCGLEKNGVGGGGEAVRQNEKDQRGGIGGGHREHSPVPPAPRRGQGREQHQGGQSGAKAGDLPSRQSGGLDRSASSGEQQAGGYQQQAIANRGFQEFTLACLVVRPGRFRTRHGSWKLTTPLQKFAYVSKHRLLTRAARIGGATVGAVAAKYPTVLMKPCTKRKSPPRPRLQ